MTNPPTGPLRGCEVLPPMQTPIRDEVTAKAAGCPLPSARSPADDANKRRTAGRFGVLNRFVDEGARLVDPTAQACWWVLFRETKPDGLATVSHGRVAECVGVDRKTITRAMARLEAAGLLTVVRHGGWRKGPNTVRVHPTPKRKGRPEGD